MPKCLKFRIIALLMVILLAGCQSPQQLVAAPASDTMVSGQMVITDKPASSSSEMLVEEKPLAVEEPFELNSENEAVSEVSSSKPEVSSSIPETASSKPESSSVEPLTVVPAEKSETSLPEASTENVSSSKPEVSSVSVSSVAVSELEPEISSSQPEASEPEVASSRVEEPQRRSVSVSSANEVRAIWITYLELAPIMQGRSQSQFTASIAAMFDNCAQYGINTIFAHVRPFGDALYKSEYFPWSYIATGVEGKDPGYDPLEIMVREAHARGMKIEAWINPYRVRHDKKYPLAENNQAKIWLDEGSLNVATNGTYIVYNPASKQARDLIVNGVREIIRNYDVDGIHIDDYFYPSTLTEWDKNFDMASYNAYRNAGGTLVHADWRRANVSTLVRAIYSAVKAEDSSVLFGISPQSSVYNNYHAMYFDVQAALANTGYCDYICPQIYFGYENDVQPYYETLMQWDKMIKVSGVKLYPGLAVYKAGLTDTWAGSGKAEWQQNNDIIARQVEDSRDCVNYGGFALYRYDSLFRPDNAVKSHVAREAENLEDVL